MKFMNNNNFFKNFLTILVVVVGYNCRIIIQHKILKNNPDKPIINTLENVEPSPKNKITEKQKLIKNLEEDFVILTKEFEIKNNNSNKYYDLKNLDQHLKYLNADFNRLKK